MSPQTAETEAAKLRALAAELRPLPKHVLHAGSMDELRRVFPVSREMTPLDRIAGIPIVLDETLPPEIVELRDGDRVLVRADLRAAAPAEGGPEGSPHTHQEGNAE